MSSNVRSARTPVREPATGRDWRARISVEDDQFGDWYVFALMNSARGTRAGNATADLSTAVAVRGGWFARARDDYIDGFLPAEEAEGAAHGYYAASGKWISGRTLSRTTVLDVERLDIVWDPDDDEYGTGAGSPEPEA